MFHIAKRQEMIFFLILGGLLKKKAPVSHRCFFMEVFFPESNQPMKVPRRFLTSDFYPALDQTGLSYIWEIKNFIKNY